MNTKLWQTKQGLWIPEFDKIWEQWIDNDLQFERHVLDLLLSHVPSARVALDLGAHVGTDTLRLGQHFSAVHAFEPDLCNFAALVENTRNRPNIHRYQTALGARHGTCALAYHGGNCGEYSVKEGFGIPMDTLDQYRFNEVDAIKIDVEGYELRVLEGARETLLRCKPAVILEVDDLAFKHHGIDRLAAPDYLKDLGAKKIAECETGGNWLFAWK